jgi:pimeloyl-ACP methyl ester carboxylesterase
MMLSALLVVPIILAAATSNRVYLPKPSGIYHVSKTQHVFNHTTLNDPLSPNNVSTYYVATILYPTKQAPTKNTTLQYMSSELAAEVERGYKLPAAQLERLWTSIQWQAPVLPSSPGLPTLLFSPGAGSPCIANTVMQSEMVSRGYTVLCIDHPGESPLLEIPYTNISVHGVPLGYNWGIDLDFMFRVNDIRKSDFDALLQQFSRLVEQYGAPFNTSSYMHFGFSLGGSIGTYLVSEYDEVLAGLDYDGSFFDTLRDPNATVDLKKPFLTLVHPLNDPTRPAFFEKQTGWYEELQVNGTEHLDFSDVGLWLDLLDLRSQTEEGFMVGTVSGKRMYEILTDFTTKFYDGVLGKRELKLQRNLPSTKWPEVVFVNGSTGIQ